MAKLLIKLNNLIMKNINKIKKYAEIFYLMSTGMIFFKKPVFIATKIIDAISSNINSKAPTKDGVLTYRARLGFLKDAPRDENENTEPVLMIGFSKYSNPKDEKESDSEYEERREKERLDFARSLLPTYFSIIMRDWNISIDYVNYNQLEDTAPSSGIGELFPFIIYRFEKK